MNNQEFEEDALIQNILIEKEQGASGNKVVIHQLQYPTKIVSVSCGLDFAVCIDKHNRLVSFGSNVYGQVGNGSLSTSFLHPQFINIQSESPLLKVECGYSHAIAYNEKEAYGWGEHRYGALGYEESHVLNSAVPRKIPLLIGSEEKLLQVSTGNNTSVFNISGSFYAIGDNQKRQLGLLLKRISHEPELIRLHAPDITKKIHIKQVKCGNGFTIALSEDGTLFGTGESLSQINLFLSGHSSNGFLPITDRNNNKLNGVRKFDCGQFVAVELNGGIIRAYTEEGIEQFCMDEQEVVSEVAVLGKFVCQVSMKQKQSENCLKFRWNKHANPHLQKLNASQVCYTFKDPLSTMKIIQTSRKSLQHFIKPKSMPSENISSRIKEQINWTKMNQVSRQENTEEKKELMKRQQQEIRRQEEEIKQQKQIIGLYEKYVEKLERENNRLREKLTERGVSSEQIDDEDSMSKKLIDLKYLLYQMQEM